MITMINKVILVVSFLAFECQSSAQVADVDRIAAIKLAAENYVSTKRLAGKSSTFLVTIQDSVYRLKLVGQEDGSYRWERDKFYSELFSVSILPDHSKQLTRAIAVGSKGHFPTGFVELHSRLFFWSDPTAELTQAVLEKLSEYKLVDSVNLTLPLEFATDDAIESVDYFFCKANPKIFKRVITRTAIGHYDVPLVSCQAK